MTAGAEFRAAFLAEYEDPDLLYGVLLDQTVSAIDLIEALEAVVTSGGLVGVGGNSQPVINPAVVELRHQRAALAKLLGALDLAGAGDTTTAGKALAAKRWGKG